MKAFFKKLVSEGLRFPIAILGVATGAVQASVLTWEFPRTGCCHEGIPFADGKTGVLVWGGGEEVWLTVGRADLWDHRGGYEWTTAQSYSNVVSLVRKGDTAGLSALFRKDKIPGEPINPMLLPFGRVKVTLSGVSLHSGMLDTATGLGALILSDQSRIELAMANGTFALRLPKKVAATFEIVSSMDSPKVRDALGENGILPPVVTATPDGARMTWRLPADPAATLSVRRRGREIALATARGEEPVQPATFRATREASRKRWKAFWREGARVRVPDPEIQEAFDYGMYRFGAMTDADGHPAGLQGPWLEDDGLIPWNGDYHFNINIQECYSPSFRGGHFGSLRPLFDMILSWRPRLRENARRFVGIDDGYVLPHSVSDRGVNIGGFWTGTIDHASTAWMASYMFRYVRYSGDVAFLRDHAYDFMKGAMNVYLAMVEEDGEALCLPVGPSPEWGDADPRRAVGRNPSFQLAAAHRLLKDLQDAAALLGEAPDPRWAEAARRLPPYNADETGILLFDGQPLSESHRHHSHLAALHPFDTLDLDDPATARVLDASIATWDARGTINWSGWCVPWASILNTHIGRPDRAVEMVRAWRRYFNNPGHASLHDAWLNGFTRMTARKHIMQLDGQCAAATAVMELMAHDVNGRVSFFRGCPAEWEDVSFENLRLSDGSIASGRRFRGEAKVTIRRP